MIITKWLAKDQAAVLIFRAEEPFVFGLLRFIAVTQGIDTDESNPAANFQLQVLGAAAEFERELIRERVLAGTRRYREDYEAGKIGKEISIRSGKNLAIGRPKRIFDRVEVFRLRADGRSLREIAQELGSGLGTVTRTLGGVPKPAKQGKHKLNSKGMIRYFAVFQKLYILDHSATLELSLPAKS